MISHPPPPGARIGPALQASTGRSAVPVEVQLALLVTGTIAFSWIDADLLFGMGALKKDFGTFLGTARAFVAGTEMYPADPIGLIENLNPPHFHLLLLPLAQLSDAWAWTLWNLAGFGCLAGSLGIIAREAGIHLTPWRLWIASTVFLTMAPTNATLATGQVGWLLMLPMTLAWRAARHERWGVTGAWLGLAISVKPFLLLLMPWLAIRRRWGALVATGTSGALALGLGLAVFGIDRYRAWVLALRGVSWTFMPMNASIRGTLARVLGGATPTGATDLPALTPVVHAPQLVTPVWLVASVVVVSLTLTAALVHDRSARQTDRSMAAVLLACLLVSPLGWMYYLWLGLGPLLLAAFDSWPDGSRTQRLLWMAGASAMLFPIPLIVKGQPSAAATVCLASAYSWGVFFMWTALIRDAWRGESRG